MSRRSPRNHTASSASPLSNLRVKAAPVPWSDQTFSLEYLLIGALEANRRWRHGLFSNVTLLEKARYCDEIARALFSRHPHFARSYSSRPSAFAKAVKEKVESFPKLFKAQALSEARTRRSSARAELETSSALLSALLWKRHRIDRESLGTCRSAAWHPALRLELQLLILHHFIGVVPPAHPNRDSYNPPAQNVNRPCATVACLVNRSWYSETVRWLYSAVTISKPCHFLGVFSPSGFFSMNNCSQPIATLQLRTPVPSEITFSGRPMVSYIQFDFGSSHLFFDLVEPQSGKPIKDMDRSEARVGALVLNSIPLYQMTMALSTKKLRLYISREHPIDPKNSIWQDLVGGHIAALRMMANLEHLVIDAQVYLLILPGYFREWCTSPLWRQALTSVRAEAETMATFFDETSLRTMSLVSGHVPTLAFLAAISRAPNISRINLLGWKKPALDPSWTSFLEEEKSSVSVIRWSDENPDEL